MSEGKENVFIMFTWWLYENGEKNIINVLLLPQGPQKNLCFCGLNYRLFLIHFSFVEIHEPGLETSALEPDRLEKYFNFYPISNSMSCEMLLAFMKNVMRIIWNWYAYNKKEIAF